VPCKHACGILTSVQSLWWKPLKEILPVFIQGMSCHDIADRLREYVKDDWKSVALDGSSWDSTQFTCLAQAGPNKFFRAIRNSLVAQMSKLIDRYPQLIVYTA